MITIRSLMVGLMTVTCVLCETGVCGNTDANRNWQEHEFQNLINNVRKAGYQDDHCTETGRKVLNAVCNKGMERWPFNEDLFVKNSKVVAAIVKGERNELQYRIEVPGSDSALVSVIWFYGKRSFPIFGPGKLQFHDLRIDTIGQQNIDLYVSEVVMNWAEARKRIQSSMPNDLRVFAGILDVMAGYASAPKVGDLCHLAQTPDQINAIRVVLAGVNQAVVLRKSASVESTKTVDETLRKIAVDLKHDTTAKLETGTLPVLTTKAETQLHNNLSFLHENTRKLNREFAVENVRDIAFLGEEDLKKLNEALNKLKPAGCIPKELNWFFDVKKLQL